PGLADPRLPHASGPTRFAIARSAGAAFAPVAGFAFLALVATGPVMALVEGSWGALSGTYRLALVVKAAVIVAVIAPLGLVHDRAVGLLAARRSEPATASRKPMGGRRLGRTLAVEGLALVTILGAGAVLSTANPLAATADGPDLLSVVSDPAECAELAVGRLSCYRRYLADAMEGQGADFAAAELERLSTSVSEVGSQCHQLAHDLGNDAVRVYGGVGEALAIAPPSCLSGFYHGIVELAVSQMGPDPSGDELATTCSSLRTANAYGLNHYDCVHGLGHGVMLLTDHQLDPALALCDKVADDWERSSCLGGAFMERIIGIQSSPATDDSNGDLNFPCNAVRDDAVDECYFLQSSYFLWKLDYDFDAGFDVCDRAPENGVETCYRSMGRDIGSRLQHQVSAISDTCRLGADPQGYAWCVSAAALDAAYTAADARAGDPFCALLTGDDNTRCVEAVEASYGAAARGGGAAADPGD
ncbi:MAG: CopD family protein, partial [Acidimicrobiia bacterium]|nr:CopD family protein [Acidimicrobiia bacterium]